MKSKLRHNTCRWAGYILPLLVLSTMYSPAMASQSNIDACGTLTKPFMCTVISLPGEYGDDYYMISQGEFDYGDYLRVIGSIYCYPGPSPCYVTSCAMVDYCMSYCETTWYVKSDGTGDVPTIQDAIDAAADGHTIFLSNGVFRGPGNRDIDFYGKAISLEACRRNPDSCIIDCQGSISDPHRGFIFQSGEGPQSRVVGVTVKNGLYLESEGGGAVRCELSSPMFIKCKFSSNSTFYNGGAAYCENSNPGLFNCTFSGNGGLTTTNGGGIYCVGSSPTLTSCTFSDNSALSYGGGISCVGGSSPHLNSCTFSVNTAGDGGGMHCDGSSPTLTDCDFSNNSAGLGGGLLCCNGSSATLNNCSFTGNTASPLGGGMYCFDSSPTLTECTFSENSTDDGAGLSCTHYSSPQVTGCIFSSNSADYHGGGLYCSDYSSPALANCTFSANAAGINGGGVACWGNSSITVDNTIIAFSTQGNAVHCESASGATLACCDVYGNAGGDWVGCVLGQDGTNGNFSINPLFCGPPGSGDYTLQWNSPCAPANSPCASLVGALPVVCGAAGELVQCPGDHVFPMYTTWCHYNLKGFVISNPDSFALAYDYNLTSEGPATLAGDPLSLSGTTPVLSPGESYTPPWAVLVIPEIREYSKQFVTYHVSAVGHPDIVGSCTAVMTFDPPVTVQITDFKGRETDSGVELVWDVVTDEEINGFEITRRVSGVDVDEPVNSGDLIPPQRRSYVDGDVQGGKTYLYTLSVVRADGSKVSSQTIKVKTRTRSLALFQNCPNPFNPSTTISFTLPERIHARLSIYNVEGKFVVDLIDEVTNAGFKEVSWEGKDARGAIVTTGVYFYCLRAGKKVLTRKMVLLR